MAGLPQKVQESKVDSKSDFTPYEVVSTKKGSESNSIGDVNYHRKFAPSKSPLVATKTTIHLVGLLVLVTKWKVWEDIMRRY